MEGLRDAGGRGESCEGELPSHEYAVAPASPRSEGYSYPAMAEADREVSPRIGNFVIMEPIQEGAATRQEFGRSR